MTQQDQTVPRVTTQHIDALVASLAYETARVPNTTSTIATARLPSGFVVGIGHSACVSPANFDAELGRKYAIEDASKKARDALWQFEGYLLAHQLTERADTEIREITITNAEKYQMRLDDIGRVCHEVNRAYCQALGDDSQPTWEDAPAWQRESARMGVDLHMSGNFGPEASHISWMQQKLADGWTYGPVKDPELKQHPCLVPFDQLPREQQAKDYLFRGVVHALR